MLGECCSLLQVFSLCNVGPLLCMEAPQMLTVALTLFGGLEPLGIGLTYPSSLSLQPGLHRWPEVSQEGPQEWPGA